MLALSIQSVTQVSSLRHHDDRRSFGFAQLTAASAARDFASQSPHKLSGTNVQCKSTLQVTDTRQLPINLRKNAPECFPDPDHAAMWLKLSIDRLPKYRGQGTPKNDCATRSSAPKLPPRFRRVRVV